MIKSLRSGIHAGLRDLALHTSTCSASAVAQGIFLAARLLVSGESYIQTGGHTYAVCASHLAPDDMTPRP